MHAPLNIIVSPYSNQYGTYFFVTWQRPSKMA